VGERWTAACRCPVEAGRGEIACHRRGEESRRIICRRGLGMLAESSDHRSLGSLRHCEPVLVHQVPRLRRGPQTRCAAVWPWGKSPLSLIAPSFILCAGLEFEFFDAEAPTRAKIHQCSKQDMRCRFILCDGLEFEIMCRGISSLRAKITTRVCLITRATLTQL